MRIPDPKANTTTEAYLAYKAGYLEESELKPVLYEPYLHFDAWLAYWAGLTNEYPLDKNGDPEMLTDEEALVAYLAGVTDTYPEEIKDPYDVRIVGYLKHLVSIRWPEPDYPVNNEEFYLSTMEPTHTSNPVPSSDIELDTAEGKIISVEAYGDTYQQTYSGYNLIDLVPMTNTQPTRDQQCTVETKMDATLGRNVLHIIGTNNYPSIVYQLPQRLESGKYYALKFTYRSTVSGSPQSETMWFAPSWSANDWDVLGSINRGGAKPGDGDTENSVGQSTTWKTTSRRFYVVPSQYSSTVYSYANICFSLGYNANATKELWLADAEVYEITEAEWNADTYTSKDYEPYVGGIPSPSPDYPQDINVVTGEQTVTTTGKNLVDWGTQAFTAYKQYSNILISAGTYTFSANVTSNDTQSPVSRVYFYNGGNLGGYINLTRGNRASATVTLATDVDRVIMYASVDYSSSIGKNATYSNIQLEEGSTATTYEPYQSQDYTVDLGNTELCKIGDYQDYIYKSGDDWYVHKETGKYTFTGSENWSYGLLIWCYSIPKSTLQGLNLPVTSTNYLVTTFTPISSNPVPIGKVYSGGTYLNVNYDGTSTADGLTAFKTWLTSSNSILYAPLVTPTDTKITDSNLIGQLDALAGADTYNEKTYIKVTATDPNLPALLKVEAYKY